MSDVPPGTPRQPDFTSSTLFMFVVALPVLLIVLLILRFATILMIDLCFLCSIDAAREDINDWLIWLRLRRRRSDNDEIQDSQEAEEGRRNVETAQPTLSDLSEERRKIVIKSILVSKVVSSNDALFWKDEFRQKEIINEGDDNEANDPSKKEKGFCVTCSICLHDIEIGDTATSPNVCDHVFHKRCILSWLEKNSSCPFCRREMVTEKDLANAFEEGQSVP